MSSFGQKVQDFIYTNQRYSRKAAIATIAPLIILVIGLSYALTQDINDTCAAVPQASTSSPTRIVTTTPPATPIAYYLSEERRAPLREAVDRIGRDWLSKLLSGEIPSTTRGWSKTAPAPYNGYGSIVSSPSSGHLSGRTFIQVTVKFVEGEVDTNMGPLGIFIIDKDGRMAGLNGDTTLHGYDGKPVKDAPKAFSWQLDLKDPLNGSMNMTILNTDAGANILPDSTLPLDRSKTYKIMLSDPENTADDYREANVGDIMNADAQILRFFHSLNVTGSDW